MIRVLSIVIFLAFVISGCGGGGGSSTATLGDTDTVLPPDPDEAGKATLAGIDSNNDGIRDDVERWIAQEYDDTTVKEALRQVAVAFQRDLLTTQDPTTATTNSEKSLEALACLQATDPQNFDANVDRLESIFYNTPDRVRQFLNLQVFSYTGGLIGIPFSESRDDICAKSE